MQARGVMEKLTGTTVAAFVIKDAIIVGYDSRAIKDVTVSKHREIVSDNFKKYREVKELFLVGAGRSDILEEIARKLNDLAMNEETSKFGVVNAALAVENFVLNQSIWEEEKQVSMLICGMQNGKPMLYCQRTYDPENKLVRVANEKFRGKRIEDKVAVGCVVDKLEEEMNTYRRDMNMTEAIRLASFVILKASLFSSATGGSIRVSCIDDRGRTETKFTVPKVYLERFHECRNWEDGSIFMVFQKSKEFLENERFERWIYRNFEFIKGGDMELFHIIGGFEGDLIKNTIFRRVVFHEKVKVDRLFECALSDGKYHWIKVEGCTVYISRPSKRALKTLLGLDVNI